MDKHRIVCAGEVMIEMAAIPGQPGHFIQGVGGDTFNTAIYLARAGLRVDYLTKLGDDEFSDTIIEQLEHEGIGSQLITRLPNRTPGLYAIENDANGERRFAYWRDNSPARELFDTPIQLPVVNAFYFSGITLAVTRSGHANLVDLLAGLVDAGCKVIFDPNYRPQLWHSDYQARDLTDSVLAYCDTVLTTLADDTGMWGISTPEQCRDFYADYNVRETIIKAPDLTAHAYIDGGHQHRQAQKLTAVDTTGAGDAFNAGYLAARMANASVEAALEAGQALAARVVLHPGAVLARDADAIV